MIKGKILASVVLAVSLVTLLFAPPEQAVGTKLSTSDLAFMIDSSERLGISHRVRDQLISNMEQGIMPLSMSGAVGCVI